MSSENRDEDRTVSDPESRQKSTDEPDMMRPIPDGGLQQSMPEWLRRPPAWRNLPKKAVTTDEAVAGPAQADQEPEQQSTQVAVQLPEADTSEIDPRSLVDITDLPQWLQDMAARSDALASPPVTNDSPKPKEDDMTDPEKRLESEPREERVVAFEPEDKKKWEVPEEEHKTYGGGKPEKGMSPQLMFLLALVALVILAIILFAIF